MTIYVPKHTGLFGYGIPVLLKNLSNNFPLLFIIINSIENKDLCEVVYLDFKKAFESIPHPELLYKLRCHGTTGPQWQWFQAEGILVLSFAFQL